MELFSEEFKLSQHRLPSTVTCKLQRPSPEGGRTLQQFLLCFESLASLVILCIYSCL